MTEKSDENKIRNFNLNLEWNHLFSIVFQKNNAFFLPFTPAPSYILYRRSVRSAFLSGAGNKTAVVLDGFRHTMIETGPVED